MYMENFTNKIKNIFDNKVVSYVDSLEFSKFKKQVSLEKRREQCENIMKKYPNRLPVICDVSKRLPPLDRNKYLLPEDIKSEAFMFIIRRRIKLEPEQAMYFFINNRLLSTNQFMSHIYDKYKDEDGFLYIYACAENTFG